MVRAPTSLRRPFVRSPVRSFSLPGWKKATLSFYCRRQRSARRRRRSRSAAAHQTKSAVVMLLILLCLVTRHSDGDGRCRCRRRREGGTAGRSESGGARQSRGAAAPGRRALAGRGKWPNRSGNTCFGRFNTLLHRSCAPPKDDGRNQETLPMTAPARRR